MSRKRLIREEAISKILSKCEYRGYEFFGFDNDIWCGSKTKLSVKCLNDGNEWKPEFRGLVSQNQKCKICQINSRKLSEDVAIINIRNRCGELNYEFIGFVGDKWDNSRSFLILTCITHGISWNTTSYSDFIYGDVKGCKICKSNIIGDIKRIPEQDAIDSVLLKCSELKYEFLGWVDNSWLGGGKTKLILKCIKHNNIWNTTTYRRFLNKGDGCSICNESKMERMITDLLDTHHISYMKNKRTYDWLVNPLTGYKLQLDFYLPDYNIAIECQGEQHFTRYKFEKTDEMLIKRKKRDKIKRQLCEEHNVKVIYVNYNSTTEDINKIKMELGLI